VKTSTVWRKRTKRSPTSRTDRQISAPRFFEFFETSARSLTAIKKAFFDFRRKTLFYFLFATSPLRLRRRASILLLTGRFRRALSPRLFYVRDFSFFYSCAASLQSVAFASRNASLAQSRSP
jgi:hypothetical protein